MDIQNKNTTIKKQTKPSLAKYKDIYQMDITTHIAFISKFFQSNIYRFHSSLVIAGYGA